MEPIENKGLAPHQLRAILPLLKARIVNHNETGFTISFGPEYGSPTTIRIGCPANRFDLRDGDILTLYTEVLLKGPTNAPIAAPE